MSFKIWQRGEKDFIKISTHNEKKSFNSRINIGECKLCTSVTSTCKEFIKAVK